MNHNLPSLGSLSMSNLVCDVAKFHQIILQQPQLTPEDQWRGFLTLRHNFIEEELRELNTAIYDADLVGAVDGLLDIIYVAIGTLYTLGLPFDPLWNAVHTANMQKERGLTKRGVFYDARKPEGWVGPEAKIRQILQELGYAPK